LTYDHRRHPLQIDLMHDAVARRNDVHVLERPLGPVDEVETIFVAAIFDRPVLLRRHPSRNLRAPRERVIDDQLHRHHRIDLGRIAAHVGNRIAQTRQIDQRGLAQDVVAHHARRKPREIEIALALDQLLQRRGQRTRIAAPHQIFRVHARGIRQRRPGAGRNRLDRRARIEIIQFRAGKRLAVSGVHCEEGYFLSFRGTNSDLQDPCSLRSGG
jgi:hypothetical protein